MRPNPNSLSQRLAHARMVKRWRGFAAQAGKLDIATLRVLQARAQELRGPMDRICTAADLRLTRPRPGAQAIVQKPLGTDWSWRPQAWCSPLHPHAYSGMAPKDRIGDEIAVFHDCALRELTLRQVRNRADSDLSPFGLRLEALGFEGSFLSLALDLPHSAFAGLATDHVIQLRTLSLAERPTEVFARLNIRNGPNTAQKISELKISTGAHPTEAVAEFDLAYVDFNPIRVEQMWVDLIFDGFAMNQVWLRDLTVLRHLRAEI